MNSCDAIDWKAACFQSVAVWVKRILRGEEIGMATSVMSAATRTPGFIAVSGRRAVAHSPYGLPIIDNCTSCKLRNSKLFCALAQESIDALDHLQHSHCVSEGSVVFLEGQQARGVYILCQGRAKLMTTNTDGKSLILKIAEPGTI